METSDKTNQKPEQENIYLNILKISIPAFVTMMSFLITEVVTTIFNGHLHDPAMIAGSGLGSM